MILITGGTGVMGTALVRRFVAAGERVRVLALPADAGAEACRAAGADVRLGDVAVESDVAGLCDGARLVYHLAAVILSFDDSVYERVNVGGTRNAVTEARRAGVGHFVHISSASVVYPKTTAYSRSKQAAERVVRESGIAHTIVRPTLVYGARGGQEFEQFLAYLRRFPVVPMIGDGSARKRPVYVEDIVRGLELLRIRPGTGAVYNFSGGESITMLAFARLCLRLQGMAGKPIARLPVWLCQAMSGVAGLTMRHPPLRWPVIAGMTQDADLDPSSAIRDLGYMPVGVTEQLPRCLAGRK